MVSAQTLPEPIASESRVSFGLLWFASEADALVWHRHLHGRGAAYNGGMLHGLSTGRDTCYDRRDADGNVIAWAVTTD